MVLTFYDLETTGFSREHNDIIEISALAWDSVEDRIIDKFSTYIKPMVNIPPIITNLTGISNITVFHSPHYWDVAPQFFSWLKGVGTELMVGYNNIAFDWQFLVAQNKRYKLDLPSFNQLDVLREARQLKKDGLLDMTKLTDLKQQTLASYFSISYKAHDSQNDVYALFQIYQHIRKLNFNLA